MNSRYQATVLALFAASLVLIAAAGCERRQFYRTQADDEVNCIIQQTSQDPRWALSGVNVMMDPRSRYYETYDPDYSPMPTDDPASNRFMHCIDGKRGYEFWGIDGERGKNMENPDWRLRLAEYVPMTEDGKVKLSRESSLRLAYVNSTDYQSQLETLYLSALDVSTERFRFDSQFFGGTSTQFDHRGPLNAGGETNQLSQDTDFSLQKQFPTAGTLLVTFANSFVWQFAGPNTNSAFSILGFTFAQPLLAGGGRAIALEQLTIVERALLANLRALERYRQGFYSDVVVGNSGASNLQRRGGFFGGTGLSGFTGTGAGGIGGVGGTAFGFGGTGGGGVGGGATGTGLAGGGAGAVGGFLGLLQTLQEFRNAQDSFDLQVRTLSVLESYNDAGQIDLVQVDQFRQSIETQRAQLLQSEIALQNSIENYLTGTLSLPPDLPVELDDQFIRPFQLVADEFTRLQNDFNTFQDRLAFYAEPDPEMPETIITDDALAGILSDVQIKQVEVRNYLDEIQLELQGLAEVSDVRKQLMTETERRLFDDDLAKLQNEISELLTRADATAPELAAIADSIGMVETERALDQILVWLRNFQFLMQEIALLQARIRVESITLEPIQLSSDEAFQIALANRFDLMNNRASIVDTWRLITFNANQLRSDLSIRLDGDISTTGDNPLNLSGGTGTMSARLEFDAPFTRLLERNNYRQSLIDYQSTRRQYIQFVDGIHSTMRSTMRQLEQLRLNLEIQRRAVVIAIRRVDATQQDLEEPLPVPVPGQAAPQRGATVAQNLLSALEDLRNTQNNFMSVWLNYYATRMTLMRDLGLMQLDQDGVWIDEPVDFSLYVGQPDEIAIPPAIPQQWWDDAFPEGMPENLGPGEGMQMLPPEQATPPTPQQEAIPPLEATPISHQEPVPSATASTIRDYHNGRSTSGVLGRPAASLSSINFSASPAASESVLETEIAEAPPAAATPRRGNGLFDRISVGRMFGKREQNDPQNGNPVRR